jgi:hypothetical protein
MVLFTAGTFQESLCNRLEVGVVGSAVGRLPDVQQSTQWLPVSVVARSGVLGVLSTLLVCVGDGLGSIAAIRTFVHIQINGRTSHLVILCSTVSVSPQREQAVVGVRRLAANRSLIGRMSWVTA